MIKSLFWLAFRGCKRDFTFFVVKSKINVNSHFIMYFTMPNDARATWIWVVFPMSWERKFAIVFVFYDIKQQIANFRFGEAFVCFLVNSRSISSIWAYNINKHVVKSTKWVSNFNKHVVKSHNCTYDVYKHVVKSLIRSYNLHKHVVKSIIRSYNVNKHVVKSTIWGLTGGATFFSHPWWGVGEPPSRVFSHQAWGCPILTGVVKSIIRSYTAAAATAT